MERLPVGLQVSLKAVKGESYNCHDGFYHAWCGYSDIYGDGDPGMETTTICTHVSWANGKGLNNISCGYDGLDGVKRS